MNCRSICFRNLSSYRVLWNVKPSLCDSLSAYHCRPKTFVIQIRCKSGVHENKDMVDLLPHDEHKDGSTQSVNLTEGGLTAEQTLRMKQDQIFLAVEKFKKKEKYRKGHVEFVKLAVKRMEEYQLQKDVNVYNQIISIFPKGRFAPKRMLDSIWPRSLPQLELSLDILTKMEENGVRPNQETYNLLNEIFGRMSLPVEKCIRIAHLFDKYEYSDPYKIYNGIPSSPVELSKLILYRITGGQGTIKVFKEISGEKSSYILGACTKAQVSLLQSKDVQDSLLHVEGPYRLWQHSLEQFYYTLRLIGGHSIMSPSQPESAKEGTVLSVCMCHPGTQETLQDWVGVLQEDYPTLSAARIVYDIKEINIGVGESVMKLSSKEANLLNE